MTVISFWMENSWKGIVIFNQLNIPVETVPESTLGALHVRWFELATTALSIAAYGSFSNNFHFMTNVISHFDSLVYA